MLHVTRRFFSGCQSSKNALMVIPRSTKYANYAIDRLKYVKELHEGSLDCRKSQIEVLKGFYKLYQEGYPDALKSLMYLQKELYEIEQELIKRGAFQKQEIPKSFEGTDYSKLSDSQLEIAYKKIISKIEKLKLLKNNKGASYGEKTASKVKIDESEKMRVLMEQEMTKRGLRFSRTPEQKPEIPNELKKKIAVFLLLFGIVSVSAIAYMTFKIFQGILELTKDLPSLDSLAKNPHLNNLLIFERGTCPSDDQVDPVKTESKMVNNQARRILKDLKKEWIEIYTKADADAENGQSSAFIAARIESEMKRSLGDALLKLHASQDDIKRVCS